MDRNASANSEHGQKDTTSSGGFLFKASNSFRRSPSKKLKPQPSDQMPALDAPVLEPPKQSAPSTRPTATQSKPGFNRAPSAPATVQTLKTATINPSKDEQMPHSATEATMTSAPFANGVKREPTSNLSKSVSAPPTVDDMNSTAGPQGLSPNPAPPVVTGNQNPNAIYQHIHDMASKRISTLDYMRKASVHPSWLFQSKQIHADWMNI
jgi:hypothetical protein